MAVPNPDPTRQTATLNLRTASGATLASLAPFTDAWELVIEATQPSLSVALPAGTYRLGASVGARGSNRDSPAIYASNIVTLASPGNASLPQVNAEAIRSITGGTVVVAFSALIERYNDATSRYEKYAHGEASLSVAAQTQTITSFKLLAQRQVIDTGNAYVRDPSDWAWVLDQYVDAGIDWVRFSYPWSFAQELSSSMTEPHASKLDAAIAAIKARGLKVMVILGAAVPCWASSDSGKDCSTFSGRFNSTTAFATPTAGWSQYGAFVTDFINRFAPDAVEGDNEPNAAGYVSAGIDATAEITRMTQLWNGVKASTYPNTVVCSPALSLCDTDYLQALYTAGLKDVCDVVAAHPYDLALRTQHTFTASAATNLLTSTAHGFKENERVIINGASLPAPLVSGTVYYAKNVTANTFGLATTFGGSLIDLTTAGSGTLTAGWTFDQIDPRLAGDPADTARMKGSLVQGLHRTHKVMRANGDGTKPIWVSEWGITTNSIFIAPVDDATKARYLDAGLRLAAHLPYVEVMGLYTLVEPLSNASGNGFGSITTTRKRLASYDQLKATLTAIG